MEYKYKQIQETKPADVVKIANSLSDEARAANNALCDSIERNYKMRDDYKEMQKPPAFGALHANEIVQKLVKLGILTSDGIDWDVRLR